MLGHHPRLYSACTSIPILFLALTFSLCLSPRDRECTTRQRRHTVITHDSRDSKIHTLDSNRECSRPSLFEECLLVLRKLSNFKVLSNVFYANLNIFTIFKRPRFNHDINLNDFNHFIEAAELCFCYRKQDFLNVVFSGMWNMQNAMFTIALLSLSLIFCDIPTCHLG